jgi:hypothetical protein
MLGCLVPSYNICYCCLTSQKAHGTWSLHTAVWHHLLICCIALRHTCGHEVIAVSNVMSSSWGTTWLLTRQSTVLPVAVQQCLEQIRHSIFLSHYCENLKSIINIDQKLMCPIQFQSCLAYLNFLYDTFWRMYEEYGDKVSPYFRPFWIGNAPDRCFLYIFALGFI